MLLFFTDFASSALQIRHRKLASFFGPRLGGLRGVDYFFNRFFYCQCLFFLWHYFYSFCRFLFFTLRVVGPPNPASQARQFSRTSTWRVTVGMHQCMVWVRGRTSSLVSAARGSVNGGCYASWGSSSGSRGTPRRPALSVAILGLFFMFFLGPFWGFFGVCVL